MLGKLSHTKYEVTTNTLILYHKYLKHCILTRTTQEEGTKLFKKRESSG